MIKLKHGCPVSNKTNFTQNVFMDQSHNQNSEQWSFFSIVFKKIRALLSYGYFQTIKITSIAFCRHVKLIIGIED